MADRDRCPVCRCLLLRSGYPEPAGWITMYCPSCDRYMSFPDG